MKKTTYQLYLREIENVKPLTAAEEKAHFVAYNELGSEKARMKIYVSNLRFVVKTAHKYKNQGVPIIDLISEGNLSLDKAVKRFDRTSGYKFITYAVWWIRQSMLQLLAEQSRFISVTGAEAGLKLKINKAAQKLAQKLGRIPNNVELAFETRLPIQRIRRIQETLSNNTVTSLDKPILSKSDGNLTLQDTIVDDKFGSPEPVDSVLNPLLKYLDEANLSEQEKDVLLSYYGINQPKKNLEEISIKWEKTGERMRQIKEKALDTLRGFENMSRKCNRTNALDEFIR